MYRIILFILSLLFYSNSYSATPPIVSAFLPVKNEINTLPACLKSIKGLFDKIVIVYVDEPDDGSVEYIKKWCTEDHKCIHKAYPYPVYPFYDQNYKDQYDFQNYLTPYYNFGLNFFESEEWVLKIDADQIYIRPHLREFVQKIKETGTDEDLFTATGYNTLKHHNQLTHLKERKLIRTNGNVFASKKKNLLEYKQTDLYETPKINYKNKKHYPNPLSFRFMKPLKTFKIEKFDQQSDPEKQMDNLSNKEIQIFEKYIRPLFDNDSVYKNIKVTPN